MVQRHAELIWKHVKEARAREEASTCQHNEMFEARMLRIPAKLVEPALAMANRSRAQPLVEQLRQPVVEPQQPPSPQVALLGEPRAKKSASERFMKKNPPIFERTTDLFIVEEWKSIDKNSLDGQP